VLARASALSEGRNKVTTADINKLVRLSNWMNYDMNVIE
jgi:hypothetical protein